MNILKRLYDDFFRPSRISEYEKILKYAFECGYEFHTILSFDDVINGGIDTTKKYMILRRDVDTSDYFILNQFLKIENKYKARCSYYFRLSTVRFDFMRQVELSGGEASYHYEELAHYCYIHRIKTTYNIENYIDELRDIFVSNLRCMRIKSGLPCLTIASHGDFVNTFLNQQNTIIINERVRKECGIIREAYDKVHMSALTYRIADQSAKDFTSEAIDAINRGEPVIELLTHPRQWHSSLLVNIKEEFSRSYKGFSYHYFKNGN